MINLDKRGQGLSTSAIVLIILGVFVLVVLIAGFALGWNSLKDRIAPSNNVDSIVTSCNVACSTQSQYDFCVLERTLKADGLPDEAKEVKGSCNYFATTEDFDYSSYGFSECAGITCPETPAAS